MLTTTQPYQCLETFNLSRFRFIISPVERLTLSPFKGSTLRGGFGTAFKRMVCLLRRENCATCMLRDKCTYSRVFESPRLPSGGAERGASHDPHPFVIEPPLEARQDYLPGELMDFDLVLVGSGANYFPYFILAFEELGRMGIGKGRGKFNLVSVESIAGTAEGNGQLLYDSESQTVRTDYKTMGYSDLMRQVQALKHDAITLHFLTPTRIKRQTGFTFTSPTSGICEQHLAVNVDFVTFIRNLLRRLSWLSELYCDRRWDLDYSGLLDRARRNVHTVASDLRWYDWGRYSSRQDSRLKMGGFAGSITFEGDLAEFLPFIKTGEYIHVGQGTAYGLGKYLVEPADGIR